MWYGRAATLGVLAIAIGISGCAREEAAQPSETTESARPADPAAELQREREQEITRLDGRVAEVERDYKEQTAAQPRGTSGASRGLREELQEDVKNIREAVNDLRTITAENWWDRHERAMRRTADDIEADVRRLAGGRVVPQREKPQEPGDNQRASSAPFTSRRDQFVSDLRARVESWEKALDTVKARGAQETELDDVRARVNKLQDDVDRLGKADNDDWWDLTRERVTEYIDRVEKSVARLDDDAPVRNQPNR